MLNHWPYMHSTALGYHSTEFYPACPLAVRFAASPPLIVVAALLQPNGPLGWANGGDCPKGSTLQWPVALRCPLLCPPLTPPLTHAPAVMPTHPLQGGIRPCGTPWFAAALAPCGPPGLAVLSPRIQQNHGRRCFKAMNKIYCHHRDSERCAGQGWRQHEARVRLVIWVLGACLFLHQQAKFRTSLHQAWSQPLPESWMVAHYSNPLCVGFSRFAVFVNAAVSHDDALAMLPSGLPYPATVLGPA